MLKVAILGANGFIGSRIVEMFYLNNLAEVRPVVRSFASLARQSRFNLDCRIADAFDQSALKLAFTGCDIVVHAVAGDPKVILGTLAPTYQAAQKARVRRLIYLSTASVHGQAPEFGTDEKSLLKDNQVLAYNNSKVKAERKLLKMRKKGSVELVLLRPGIVTGPRSSWIAGFADDLLHGKAYLINKGKGICNSIYIDNLVHAIFLSLTASDIDQQAFLVGDQEHVTWADLYRPIAKAFGLDLSKIPDAALPELKITWQDRLKKFSDSKTVQAFLSLFPGKLREIPYRAFLFLKETQDTPWKLPIEEKPVVTQEMAMLYQCQYKLPFEKATKLLGYKPIIPFSEGCRRSVGWLSFAGYPVLKECNTFGVRQDL